VREQLVLVLRLEAGKEFTDALRADLIARNRRLLDFKRVGGYVIWERDFPRTASLKIKRNLLAEEIRDRLDRADAVVPL
jgi:long-chain acyl-CoA synthetase